MLSDWILLVIIC